MTRLHHLQSSAGAAAQPNCEYRLSLLGGFRLEVKQGTRRPVRLARRKVELLLAFLVLHPDPSGHTRDRLAERFWGDTPDEQARMSLRTALAVLRKALGDQALIADREYVQINPAFPLWVDVWEFLDARSTSPEHAVTLYQGDLLPEAYEDWILAERERLRSLYLQTLLQLTLQCRSQSEYERALDYAHQVLATDPANETAHQHIMFCEMARGNRAAALTQYAACTRALQEELCVEPAPATQKLYHWIQQASGSSASDAARITNLPIPLTSFIGRRTELAQVKAALLSSRLLTLSGAGGSGKTRLAIQVAMDLVQTFRDGVWWVELANVKQPALVTQSVAKALGVTDRPKQTLSQALVSHVRDRELILILDNCEHLTAACAALADTLLRESPSLKILVTSREPLCLVGEQVWYVPTLPVPDIRHTQVDALLACESVRLFCERARAAKANWEFGEHNANAVAQICRRLDGIPLALELAAARIPALSAEEIAERLDDRFNLLITGSRVALPRQQTLRALVDWSHDLLSPQERLLFRRLAVFGGGRTLEAATRVCAFGDLQPSNVLNVLTSLVAKSLLVPAPAVPGVKTRYGFLDTIKHYALDKLEQSGEADETRRRHLEYYLEWAEAHRSELDGEQQNVFLEQYEREHINFRIALKYALEHGERASALRLGVALSNFWDVRGYFTEGRDWLQQALDQDRTGPGDEESQQQIAWARLSAANLAARQSDLNSAAELGHASLARFRELGERHGTGAALGLLSNVARMQSDWENAVTWGNECLAAARELENKALAVTALRNLGIIAYTRGNHGEARARYEESLALSRELSNPRSVALTLNNLGTVAQEQGENTRAAQLYDEALGLYRKIGAKWHIAATLSNMGNVAFARGEFASARAAHAEALQLVRELGDKRGVAVIVNNLGNADLALGDLANARKHDEESLQLRRELGDKRGVALVLGNLGDIAAAQKDYATAEEYYRQALMGLHEQGERRAILACLIGACEVAAGAGQGTRAVVLAGGIHTGLACLDVDVDRREHQRFEDTLARLRADLDPHAFEQTWNQGTSLTLEQLVDLALAPPASNQVI